MWIVKRINVALLLSLCFSLSIMSQGFEVNSPEDPGEKFPWPEGTKMALSLTFDDARLSQIDEWIWIDHVQNVGRFVRSVRGMDSPNESGI